MEVFVPKDNCIQLERLKHRIADGLSFFDYIKLMATGNYAPGLEAIENRLREKYPSIEPTYMSVPLNKIKKTPIDGFRIYRVENDYFHIITLGMSELYSNESSFGRRFSKYGYEMSAKLRANSIEECYWLLDKMLEYGEHTKKTECYFVEDEVIYGNAQPLKAESDLTSIIVTEDNTLGSIETVHGEVQFLQLVAMTEKDACKIKHSGKSYETSQEFLTVQQNDNFDRIIDLVNTKDYL